MFKDTDLAVLGLKVPKKVHYNYPPDRLVKMAVERGEGVLASNDALVVSTGERTGRSPKDRYIVETAETKKKIWWGEVNRPTSEKKFDHLFERIKDFLSDKELFVFDAFSGADKRYRLPVRVVSPKAWHALFAETLFVRPKENDRPSTSSGRTDCTLTSSGRTDCSSTVHRSLTVRGELVEPLTFEQGFTVINASDLRLDPSTDGFGSKVAILLNFKKRIILIAGTGYGGEMKKGIFAVMNYLLPERGVFPMHCSANVGEKGDSALFFGLSGTGKTTLSADPTRHLIGDDEHGWSDHGIFNFEGGCYAKCIHLSEEAEPQIYNAIKFGSIVENVIMDPATRVIDYDDGSITENTRATYPVEYIPRCLTEGVGPHPKNIFFLTCDAFGVLPPIAKLTPEMAKYQFISGYTAKLAGTEVGVIEPVATFSACFGAPFLPLHPATYAKQLGERLERHQTNCWLVNTGWSGGAYGEGSRMKISITRALLSAAISGDMDGVTFKPHPVFGVLVPSSCPGVPQEVLDPENTWKDKGKYKETAQKLAALFKENYKKFENY